MPVCTGAPIPALLPHNDKEAPYNQS